MSDENDWSDYESGPFCRHWGDPADCDIPCGRCGHRCSQHGGGSCIVDECACDEFVDVEDYDPFSAAMPRKKGVIEEPTKS